MKNLILFDVDGTLTKSRLVIENPMIETLKKLKSIQNIDIGIVGGSDLSKQKQQLGDILNMFDWVFSENGLVAFENNVQFNCENIVNKLGNDSFTILINICLKYLSKSKNSIKRGTFIEYRNGMINISPIGRSCSQKEREQFFLEDKKEKYREKLIKKIKNEWEKYIYQNNDCQIKLCFSIGGQISIDIFPEGWDKTYCLQFVKEKYENIYFFGDKTDKGGNDYEIFNSNYTIGYKVENPEQTIKIIEKEILKL